MSAPKKQSQRGFTLVELLVTITIFVILTGIVLFSQSKFNSSILLTNLAYDTALTIRQAQTYGINVKEFNSEDKFLPYGVHFDINYPKSFILYADLNYSFGSDSDIKYDGDGSQTPELNLCQPDMGCVNRYSIKRGNYISDLCVNAPDNSDNGTCEKKVLDIVFQRPNPDALIKVEPVVSDITNATIIIKGSDGSTRRVRVGSNGLIEVLH